MGSDSIEFRATVKFLFKLACVIGVGYAIWWFGLRDGCGTKGALACPEPALEEGIGVTLKHSEVCRTSGYLCVERKKKFQVVRWALTKGKLRVRVRLPQYGDEDSAEQIRAAAVEGIKVWDGHPFPLVIDDAEFSLRLGDINVSWTKGLYNAAAGLNRWNYQPDGKGIDFSVEGLTVVIPPSVRVDDELLARVKAVATHEMGHALGLLHSDSKKDIMFPRMEQGKKYEISKRDYKTVDALYALPNGAMVE